MGVLGDSVDKPRVACKYGHTEGFYKSGKCKECVKIYKQKYYLENRESILRGLKQKYHADPEKHREQSRRWRKNNPEKVREGKRRWSDANPEKLKEQYRRKYAKNPEKHKDRMRLWVANNPEKSRAIKRNWMENNRELHNHQNALQRAARRGATPPWADKKAIETVYKNCPKGHHVDHIIPLKGKIVCGLHVETNLQYLTAAANRSKNNKFNPEAV